MNKLLSKEELEYEFHSKIMVLEELVANAKKKKVTSKAREEYANLISVILRVLLCADEKKQKSLVNRCGYNEFLFFPLYSNIEACNLIRNYIVLNRIVVDGKQIVQVRDDLTNDEIVYASYLSEEAWLLEGIADFKDKDYPPLSRWEIIKLIADKQGAHLDSEIDGRIYKISQGKHMPFSIDCIESNIYTELIISIAIELIFAYRHMILEHPKYIKEEGYYYVQKYANSPLNSYKFIRSNIQINAYNSNMFFKCEVEEHKAKIYQMQFRERLFDVAIITI